MSISSSINLLADAAIKGELILFVGAGASLGEGSDFPSGHALGQLISKQFGIRAKGDNSLGQISELAELKFGRTTLIDEIKRIFSKPQSNTQVHGLMSHLPCEYIITTNYDVCIEKNLRDRQKEYDVILDGKDLITRSSERTKILKIHGSVDDYQDRFIVTERDYYEKFLSSNNFFIEAIKVLLLKNTCLFVGFSMQDVNFRELYFDLKARLGIEGVKGRFFSIQRSSNSASQKIWLERGVVTIKGNHTEIVSKILRRIDELTFAVQKNKISTTERTVLGRLPISELREFERKNGEHEQRYMLFPKRVLEGSGLIDGDWVLIKKDNSALAKCRVFSSPFENNVLYAPMVVRNMLRVNDAAWRPAIDYQLIASKYFPAKLCSSIKVWDEAEIFQLPLDFLKEHSEGQEFCTLRALEFYELGLLGRQKVTINLPTGERSVLCMKMSSNPGRAGIGLTASLFEQFQTVLQQGKCVEIVR